jgi:hypothetical protein
MSTPSQNPAGATTPSASQFTSAANTALAGADTNAATSVQTLQQVHQARVSQLTRAAATLKAKFGASDPRTVAAQAKVTAETSIVAQVSVASQQASTPAPTVATGGWALHGRVYDAQLKPAAQLTVYLVDNTKTYQQQYGFAYTDSTGYFLINYAPPAGQAASTTPLYVSVANTKGEQVYLSSTAFAPAAGSASYQSLSLATGAKPLGDLPAQIQKVAVPPEAEKAPAPKPPAAK